MGLKDKIEGHPVVFFLGAVVVAFGSGWGALMAVQAATGAEVVGRADAALLAEAKANGVRAPGSLSDLPDQLAAPAKFASEELDKYPRWIQAIIQSLEAATPRPMVLLVEAPLAGAHRAGRLALTGQRGWTLSGYAFLKRTSDQSTFFSHLKIDSTDPGRMVISIPETQGNDSLFFAVIVPPPSPDQPIRPGELSTLFTLRSVP